MYAHSGVLPARLGASFVIAVASVATPVALPIKISSSRKTRTPSARATSWPVGKPSCDERNKFLFAKSAGPAEVTGSGNRLNEFVIDASIL